MENWILYGTYSGFFASMSSTIVRAKTMQLSNFYMNAIVSFYQFIFFGIYMIYANISFEMYMNKELLFLFIIYNILSTFGNIMFVKGIKESYSYTFANMLQSGIPVINVFIEIIFLKNEISEYKILGVILIFIACLLMCLKNGKVVISGTKPIFMACVTFVIMNTLMGYVLKQVNIVSWLFYSSFITYIGMFLYAYIKKELYEIRKVHTDLFSNISLCTLSLSTIALVVSMAFSGSPALSVTIKRISLVFDYLSGIFIFKEKNKLVQGFCVTIVILGVYFISKS